MNKQTLAHETQADRPGNFITGLVIGGLAGAATMLLLAPQSGKETRQRIRQKTLELRDQTKATMEGTVGQIREKADQLKSDVRERAVELRGQGQEVLMEQLDRVSEAAEKGKRAIQGKSQS
jgi:gas vesicle protein